ncbi:MAG: DnaB-like helicase N-terminal domain-containing protein [Patescibacteria group bacterium]|nr:DnaB-like helicase N-terminal domain-containing protein [Patescibacteria group bacterium]
MSNGEKNQTTEEIGRMPPQNIEAEQSLLSCILIDKDAIIKVADIISENDFYKDTHRLIFIVIKELYNHREPIDILTLTNRLEEKKQLSDIGGRTYLAQLSSFVATSSNVVQYANIVQRKATLRRLQTAASEIMDLSYQEEEEIDKVLDQTEQKNFFRFAEIFKKYFRAD